MDLFTVLMWSITIAGLSHYFGKRAGTKEFCRKYLGADAVKIAGSSDKCELRYSNIETKGSDVTTIILTSDESEENLAKLGQIGHRLSKDNKGLLAS